MATTKAERSPYEDALRQLSVEDIEAYYKSGDILAGDRSKMLRDKANFHLRDLVTDQGWGALWPIWIEHLQKNWDDAVKSASEGVGTENVGTNLYNEISTAWSGIQLILSPLTALGDVTGIKAEQAALRHGASPGLAWFIGRGADIASGFAVPTNLMARGFAKLAKASNIGQKLGGKAAEETVTDVPKLVEETKALVAAAEGLAKDGVKNAETIVAKVAAEAGNHTFKEGLKKATEAVEKIEQLAKEADKLPKGVGAAFELSKGLAGAKPNYGYGAKQFSLEFSSQLDKALYILAQKSPSKADAKYLAEVQEWLAKNNMTLSTSEIRTLGASVRARIKELASKAESGTLQIPRVTNVSELAKRAAELPSFVDDAARIAQSVTSEQARVLLPEMMKRYGVSYPDLKRIKTLWGGERSWTAAQFYGYLVALEPRTAELARLAKQAIAQGAMPAQQNEFARYATQLFTGNTEKLKYSSDFMKLLTHWDPANVAKGDIAAAMRTFATDLARLSSDDITKFTLRNQDGFVRFGELGAAGYEISRNLLLPVSTPGAVIGNSVALMNTVLERIAAGNIKEAWYVTKGMTLATADGLKAIKMAFQTSGSKNLIPGGVGRGINVPTDAMIGWDAFTKVLAFRGHLYGEALREAELAGARNVGAFVRNWVKNPSPSAVENGWEVAQRASYQNTLGWFGQRFTELVRGGQGGPGTLYFMFVKSPINLVKYGWNHSPALQLVSRQLYRDIMEGGAVADMAIGRMTIATLQGMLIFELARDGLITGNGPTDPDLRRAWLATHQPYSVKTPFGWVPYRTYAPVAMSVGLIADLVEITDRLSAPQAEQIAMAATFSLINNVADQTAYMQLSSLVDVANGVSRGERLSTRDKAILLGPMLSLASGGPGVSRTAQAMDPVSRDARTLIDNFKRRLPGYSKEVPPLRDAYGDVVIPPETPGSPWFGYFYPLVPKVKPLEKDRVKLEGSKLNVKAPAFPDSITRSVPHEGFDLNEAQPGDPLPVGINQQQRDRWQQIYRNIIRGAKDEKFQEENPGIERGLLDTDYYKQAPLGLQRKLFESFLSSAKKGAKEAMLLEDEQLFKKMLTAEAGQALQMVPREDRLELTDQFADAKALFEDMAPEQRDNLLKWGVLVPDEPVVRDDRVLYEPRPIRQPKASDFAPGGSFYQDKDTRERKTDVDLKVLP